MTNIYLANSFSGELFPVDKYVVESVIKKYKRGVHKKSHEYHYTWVKRNQTILDMLRSGW